MGQRRGFLVWIATLDLVIRCQRGASTTGPIAKCRSPPPSTRTRAIRARPSLLGVENAPRPGSRFVWEAKLGESHLGTTGRADGLGLLLLRGLGSLLILWVVSGDHEQKGQQWLVDVSLHRQRACSDRAHGRKPRPRGSPAERGVQKFYRLAKFARGDGAAETGADGHAPQRGRGKRRGTASGTWQRASCWRWSGG